MKTFLNVGKVLTALFWGVVLANLLQPFAQPFALLLHAIAGLIALIHGLELWLFNSRLANCEKPWQHQAQVLNQQGSVFDTAAHPRAHHNNNTRNQYHQRQRGRRQPFVNGPCVFLRGL